MDHGQCLTEETLADYLAGELDPAVKAASETHLLTCNDCRSRLAFFMRLLKEDVRRDEAETLQVVASAWGKKAPVQTMTRRVESFKSWLLPFAVAAVLIVGFMSVLFIRERMNEPKSGSEIVQLLLQRQRPFESRLSEEPYLPIVRTRGTDDPGVAYGLLAGEMTRLSANAHQMGRFYLLQKDFDRAIPYLEVAERETGAGAEIHNDLGVAYLESGRESEQAAKEFRDALELDPEFLPAVFNLAMLYERTGAISEAKEQWTRYLQMDSQSQWASEVRSRLQELNR